MSSPPELKIIYKEMVYINNIIKKALEFKDKEKFSEAIELLEEEFRRNPLSQEIKKNLIEILFSYGGYLNDDYVLEFDKAKKMFLRIIELDHENYRAYYNLGISYFNLENFEKARESYKMALKIKPDYKHCYYNIGLIYEAEEDFENALKYFEKALEIDPNFMYAMHARNEIRTLLDNLKFNK